MGKAVEKVFREALKFDQSEKKIKGLMVKSH